MSDDFERRLERMFAHAPALPDEARFAARVRTRLDQGQSVRTVLIGLAGGLGALIASAQVLSAGVAGRASEAGARSLEALELGWGAVTRDAAGLLSAAPVPTELWWTAAALGALVVAYVATRLADAS